MNVVAPPTSIGPALPPAVGEGGGFRYGAAVYPLRADAGGPLPTWSEYAALLRDADPARFYAIDFFAFSLNFHLSERLAAESEKAGRPIRQAVAAVGTVDPAPFLEGGALSADQLPLLALYRRRSAPRDVSTVYARRDATWQVRYVLPALNYDQARKLDPILRSVEAVLDWAAEYGWHPRYAPPGGALGQQAWAHDLAGLDEVRTGDSTWEWLAPESGGEVYLSLSVDLVVKERRWPLLTTDPGGPGSFAGTDTTFAVASESAEGEAPDPAPVPLVSVASDVPGPKAP
jgi:hypothetical protein